MSKVTFKGDPIETAGNLPEVNAQAPDFVLTAQDLSIKTLKDYAGKKLILNIFPSVDTGVCQASVRKFNQESSTLENTVVVNVSADLPFAFKRFCGAEGIENVESLSDMNQRNFGETYGVRMESGPLTGLFSRAVVVINENGQVVYTEQVPEITQEPNYEGALAAVKG